ncbi:MAG TPA: hypothetical protein VFP84_13830, partial [Kofleriaceae bacterium]|nr:hypothetical protein [Kofleriaceae bacterium]
TAGPGATATCAVAGFPAGHFGAACTGPAGAVPCLAQPDATAACRQWRPCDAPGPGGCAVAGDASWLTALVAVFGALARSRRPRGAQSNQ